MPSAPCYVNSCWGSQESKHRFPNPVKYMNIFIKWVYLCGNKRLVREMTPEKIYNNGRICSLHFKSEDFGANHKLKRGVLPSLQLPDPLKCGSVNWKQSPEVTSVSATLPEKSVIQLSMETSLDEIPGTSQSSSEQVYSTPKKRSILLSEVGVSQIKDLTPKAHHLYERALQFKRRELSSKKTRQSLKKRFLDVSKATDSQILKKVVSSMDRIRGRFFESQVENMYKKPKGRRYTLEDKVLALALYKQSGVGYRFLSKLFALPSRKILMKLLNRIPVRPGLHKEVFTILKLEAKTFKNPLDKHCLLMFDEMSIQAHLHPNINDGSIEGFEDFGFKNSGELANHAQVFMLRGIRRKWKQPICYTFVNGGTKKFDLVHLIKNIISECHNIGLNIIATVCDQGANNQAAINYLVKTTQAEYTKKRIDNIDYFFEIDGKRIIPLFDVPHIFKGLRNNLMKYNLHFMQNGKEKLAKWEHIITSYKMDPYLGSLRLMPKLTDSHVMPDKINKMKVAKCTQVFSHSVAAAVNVFSFSGTTVITEEEILNLGKDASDTASLLEFLDQLFDSLNGSSFNPSPGKYLRVPVTKSSPHISFWDNALQSLASFYFIKNGAPFIPPSLRNLIINIKNFKFLSGIMTELQFSHIMPRTFNQDPLENFFGKLRQRGQRNVNPTPTDFSHYYKSLMVNGFTSKHSVGANCEDDQSEVFLTLQKLISQGLPEDEEKIESFCIVPDNLRTVTNPIESKVLKYVSGYIGKKIGKQPCNCKELFFERNKPEDFEDDTFIHFKEYDGKRPHLKYVNSKFLGKLKIALTIIKYIFDRNFYKPKVLQYTMETLCSQISFTPCFHDDKLKRQIFKYFIRVNVFNYCNQLNRVLKGLDQRSIPEKAPKIFLSAKNMYLSTCKRKKSMNKNRFANCV